MFSIRHSVKKFLSIKRYYLKIITSFAIIIFATLLIISAIFTNIYTNDIGTWLSTDYLNNIGSVCNEFDNSFYQLTQMNIYLRNSPAVVNFLTTNEKDDYTSAYAADLFSRGIKNLNRYLYSILIYNRKAEIAITVGQAGINIDQFLTGRQNRFTTSGNIDLYSCTAIPSSLVEIKEMLTFSAVFADYTSSGIIDNAIIMNIDRKEIEQKLFGNLNGALFVCDNNGQVVLNSHDPENKASVVNEDYFRRIVSSPESSGTFMLKTSKSENIVTYKKSEQTGFYIINIRSINDYTGTIKKKVRPVIIFSFVVLLFLLSMSFIFSRNIYNPVKTITKKLTDINHNANLPRLEGEFAFISNVFDHTLQQLTNLENIKEASGKKIKEEFLRCLLKNRITVTQFNNEYKESMYTVDLKNAFLVCIKIDNYSSLNNREGFALESTLCSMIPELLNKDFNCEAVNMFEGEIALFLNFKNANQNKFDELLNAMDNLRAVSQNNLQFTLTIGIGGISNNMEDFVDQYHKAVEMAKHRFILGYNKTIYQRLLDDTLTSNISFPGEFKSKLIKAIHMNDKGLYEESLRNIMAILSIYPYSQAVSILFQIITDCVVTIDHTTNQGQNKSFLDFDEFNSIFAGLEILDQAYEWLMKLFDKYQRIIEDIKLLKNNKHYKVIENMQSYIKDNFQDINICIESISEATGYTPYYFSKIFRDIVGMNITDYIRKIRIDKAKELLENSDLTVSDIAVAVGIPNTNHFYTIFKKDVGLTPSVYREYMEKK